MDDQPITPPPEDLAQSGSVPQMDRAPQSDRGARRRFPLSNLQIILIVLIAIGGRLAIDFSQRIVEGQKKINEQHALESEIAELEREQQRLEAEKAYYSSSGFVEAWAHDEGKMVRDGERIVVPQYEDIPEQAAQQAPPTAEQQLAIPVWQVWWTLFFDTAPPLLTPSS
jgi:cell division protein FtsB